MKLIHLDSSILGEQSVTHQLSAAIVDHFKQADDALEVRYHDLAAQPLEHLTLAALGGPNPALDEFLAADVIVIGAPMYNFGVPSNLKAWLDRIAVAGKTFKYTDKGPVGLAGGKRVIVASARGGVHSGSPLDHQEPYLTTFFNFLGVTDVRFVRAEGVALGPEARSQSIATALADIQDTIRAAA